MEMAQRPADPETGMPAFFVVRCYGARKPSRFDGDLCGGFVARFPYAVRLVRLIEHSDAARSRSFVVACKSCCQLHELEAESRQVRKQRT